MDPHAMPSLVRRAGVAPEDFEHRFGLRPEAVLALTWVGAGLIAAFAVLLSIGPSAHAIAYDVLTDERGPVEVLTFLCFAAAAILSARLGLEARRRLAGRGLWAGTACFAALCAFAALEEISWGQSFFDFTGPAGWVDLNLQGETNVHNLPGLMRMNSAFVCAFGIAGVLAARLKSSVRFGAWATPSALWPLFALVAAMGAIETLNDFVFLGYRPAALIGAVSEVVEMLGAVGCVTFVWLNGRMLRRQWRRPSLTEEVPCSGDTLSHPEAA